MLHKISDGKHEQQPYLLIYATQVPCWCNCLMQRNMMLCKMLIEFPLLLTIKGAKGKLKNFFLRTESNDEVQEST